MKNMKTEVNKMKSSCNIAKSIINGSASVVGGIATVLSVIILVAHFTSMQLGESLEFFVANFMIHEEDAGALAGKGEDLLLIFAVTVLIIFLYKKISKKLSR